MTFDEWFEIQPHPAMSEQEIAEMRRDYKYAWDAALKHARPEEERNSVIDECIEACKSEYLDDPVKDTGDEDYDNAIKHCIDALYALKSSLPQRNAVCLQDPKTDSLDAAQGDGQPKDGDAR